VEDYPLGRGKLRQHLSRARTALKAQRREQRLK
jgi:hypothetical protein